jgi:hypothetical protein
VAIPVARKLRALIFVRIAGGSARSWSMTCTFVCSISAMKMVPRVVFAQDFVYCQIRAS